MAESSRRKRGPIAARAVAAALTAVLVGTGTSAVAADSPGPQPSLGAGAGQAPAAPAVAAADAPVFALYGVDKTGYMYSYSLNGTGGFESRVSASDDDWSDAKDLAQVDHNADGESDAFWMRYSDGSLVHYPWDTSGSLIGGGWNAYNKLLSAGNLGGGTAGDLLARDGSGNLYLYLGYGNGKLTTRYKVGSGWGIYNQIAGNGDLTGDGKADIVARDSGGTLWMYKGTGNYKAPFASRAKIGGGWNTYNTLVSTGDLDLDGKADLVARGTDGSLWRYSGTGVASAPFKGRVKIGNGGWNTYRLFF